MNKGKTTRVFSLSQSYRCCLIKRNHQKSYLTPLYATILVYLNDDFEGGNTDFPKVGVSATPKEGDGVLWYSCWRPNCRLGATGCSSKKCKCFDESLHLGAPPTTGVKYALNVWIRFDKAK
jgi:hypothetical protein